MVMNSALISAFQINCMEKVNERAALHTNKDEIFIDEHRLKSSFSSMSANGLVIQNSTFDDNEKQLSDCRIFQGHCEEIRSVAVSPDGNAILTGCCDGTACLWDSKTGIKQATFRGHSDEISSVAFHPKDATILTGSFDTIAYLWDSKTGLKLIIFKGHKAAITSVSLDHDGRTVLTGSFDKSVCLWNAQTGELLKKIEKNLSEVCSVTFSYDGKRFLVGSTDNTARLFLCKTGLQENEFKTSGWVTSVAFNPDATKILIGSDCMSASLWDVSTGKKEREFVGHQRRDILLCIGSLGVFSPDGRTVLIGLCSNSAILWDVYTGKQLLKLAGHTGCISSGCFSPDGKAVFTGSFDKSVRLWDISSSSNQRTLEKVKNVPSVIIVNSDDTVSFIESDRIKGGPLEDKHNTSSIFSIQASSSDKDFISPLYTREEISIPIKPYQDAISPRSSEKGLDSSTIFVQADYQTGEKNKNIPIPRVFDHDDTTISNKMLQGATSLISSGKPSFHGDLSLNIMYLNQLKLITISLEEDKDTFSMVKVGHDTKTLLSQKELTNQLIPPSPLPVDQDHCRAAQHIEDHTVATTGEGNPDDKSPYGVFQGRPTRSHTVSNPTSLRDYTIAPHHHKESKNGTTIENNREDKFDFKRPQTKTDHSPLLRKPNVAREDFVALQQKEDTTASTIITGIANEL